MVVLGFEHTSEQPAGWFKKPRASPSAAWRVLPHHHQAAPGDPPATARTSDTGGVAIRRSPGSDRRSRRNVPPPDDRALWPACAGSKFPARARPDLQVPGLFRLGGNPNQPGRRACRWSQAYGSERSLRFSHPCRRSRGLARDTPGVLLMAFRLRSRSASVAGQLKPTHPMPRFEFRCTKCAPELEQRRRSPSSEPAVAGYGFAWMAWSVKTGN